MLRRHHPSVFGGYSGCVSEIGLIPGGQDGFGGISAMAADDKKYILYPNNSLYDTGNTIQTQKQWILWGYPMDKYELNKRTGLNPTIVFPLNRGTYPSYSWRGSHGNDAADLIAMQKDFLVYEGAHGPAFFCSLQSAPARRRRPAALKRYVARVYSHAASFCILPPLFFGASSQAPSPRPRPPSSLASAPRAPSRAWT